jgi:hypothetical protein
LSAIIVEREAQHQKSGADALTLDLVFDTAERSGRSVCVVAPKVRCLEAAIHSAPSPPVVISFARELEFLNEIGDRSLQPMVSRFVNEPKSAMFCARLRFLAATSSIASATSPRWVQTTGDRSAALSESLDLCYPLWVHHPLYNTGCPEGLGTRVDSDAALAALGASLGMRPVLLQEHVEGDLRKVYFANGRVVSHTYVNPQQEAVALALAQASGSGFFGLDFVIDGDSTWILEMNDWPSFSGHEVALAHALSMVFGP